MSVWTALNGVGIGAHVMIAWCETVLAKATNPAPERQTRVQNFKVLQRKTKLMKSRAYGLQISVAKLEGRGMTVFGYARVSTVDQDYARQVEALKAAGAEKVFSEKISGARADRPQLAKLMDALKADDVVMVTKLDRLGRSTTELFALLDRIDRVDAGFRSLGDPMWDTTTPQGKLLRTILAGVAEFERDIIQERTSEGRKRAMANGVQFGRKPKLTPHQRAEAIQRRAAGETLTDIAKSYAVDVSTISRLKTRLQCSDTTCP
jgi:DNA invertase Pin-like site-specific DNA recombinase